MTRSIASLCISCLALLACDDASPADAGPPDVELLDAALDGGPAPDAGPTPDGSAPDGSAPDGSASDAGPCIDSPENTCRETRCDDGEPVTCPMAEPDCGPESIAAARDGCWVCVNPDICRPWDEPGCATDVDCPSDQWCNRCARGSCPECEDCVAECAPHGCPTEPEPLCNAIRPDCEPDGVAVVADGCWVCVDRNTCAPIESMACGPEQACPPDRICDPCGTSSCPDCDDCVPACVPVN